MRIAFKIWLEDDGRAFGEGPALLLRLVEQTGSLREAAAQIGMSYNKAWRILHAAEARLGFPLLERSAGGTKGGGSELTPEGRELLGRFTALETEAGEMLDAMFAKHFGPGPSR